MTLIASWGSFCWTGLLDSPFEPGTTLQSACAVQDSEHVALRCHFLPAVGVCTQHNASAPCTAMEGDRKDDVTQPTATGPSLTPSPLPDESHGSPPYLCPIKGTPIKLWKSPDARFVTLSLVLLFRSWLLVLQAFHRVWLAVAALSTPLLFIHCRKTLETLESDSEESCIVIDEEDSDDSCIIVQVESGKLFLAPAMHACML